MPNDLKEFMSDGWSWRGGGGSTCVIFNAHSSDGTVEAFDNATFTCDQTFEEALEMTKNGGTCLLRWYSDDGLAMRCSTSTLIEQSFDPDSAYLSAWFNDFPMPGTTFGVLYDADGVHDDR